MSSYIASIELFTPKKTLPQEVCAFGWTESAYGINLLQDAIATMLAIVPVPGDATERSCKFGRPDGKRSSRRAEICLTKDSL
jgi:hypothetical protein